MVDMPQKTTHFRAVARWRSGYAEDCKSTYGLRKPSIVRTILALFTPPFCVTFTGYCELFAPATTPEQAA